MKKIILFGLVATLLLPLLLAGCTSSAATNTAPATQTIEITYSEFVAQNAFVKNIDLATPGTLTVKLDSNPTTGYSWGEAEIIGPDIIKQISREYLGPETVMPGAGGTEVWVFNSLKTGTATIKFSYGQSWSGGEKNTFTLTVNVQVK